MTGGEYKNATRKLYSILPSFSTGRIVLLRDYFPLWDCHPSAWSTQKNWNLERDTELEPIVFWGLALSIVRGLQWILCSGHFRNKWPHYVAISTDLLQWNKLWNIILMIAHTHRHTIAFHPMSRALSLFYRTASSCSEALLFWSLFTMHD